MMPSMSPRSLCICGLVVVAVSLAPAARAAQPGVGKGTIMISAERFFGFSAIRTSQDIPGGELHVNQQSFGLALSPTLEAPYVYRVPRLGFDFALIDGLTLGGALGFATGDSGAEATMTTFLLAPRVGYVLGFSRAISLWLRGGFTYFNHTTRNDPDTRSTTLWGTSLNVEPALMISPFEHVAFTASLLLDLPVAGKLRTERVMGNVTTTSSVGLTVRHIGLMAGLVISF